MIYTIGGSFWEFGGPDLERAKLFVMIGTAEDHHSNPMKIALGEVQARRRPLHLDQPGAHRLFGDRRRMDADPPGTDGALLHGAAARVDRHRPGRPRFLQRYTNAPQLVVLDEGEREGLFARIRAAGPPGDGYAIRTTSSGGTCQRRPVVTPTRKASKMADAWRSRATSRCRTERGSLLPSSCCASAWPTHSRVGRSHHRHPGRAHPRTGPRAGRRRCTRRSNCRSPGPTPGARSTRRPRQPVAFHAMRGLAAHSNGFQTVRSLAILMSVLGTIDRPAASGTRRPIRASSSRTIAPSTTRRSCSPTRR
jgi:anaerobic selenocysteine-containing dehydrogenase